MRSILRLIQLLLALSLMTAITVGCGLKGELTQPDPGPATEALDT